MSKGRFQIRLHPVILISATCLTLLYPGTSFLPASEEVFLQIPHNNSPRVQQISELVEQKAEAEFLKISPSVESGVSDSPEISDVAIIAEKKALANEIIVKEHTFKRGDSFSKALFEIGLSAQEIHEIVKVSKSVFDLRKVRAGQSLKVSLQKSRLRFTSLHYEFELTQTLKVERVGDQWLASKEETPLTRDITRSAGTITNSLYASAKHQGVPVEIILKLSDIFAWDVDFGIDIRDGDQFNIVYEVFKKEGRMIRSGRVLAAELINQGRNYPAYYFDPQGEGGDYYDEGGRSLKKAFLKSPLRYRYISSGYSRRRLHPILKVNRPHLGIDFAAARGTPVRAASDGIIAFAGWKGGHGKTVIIRHKNGYQTLYGHLSSYWADIKEGKRVKQEDFIGRVGSTGLSTGPHLHYTLIKDGRAINPSKVALLRGEALAEEWFSLFSLQIEQMNRILYPELKLVEGSGTT